MTGILGKYINDSMYSPLGNTWIPLDNTARKEMSANLYDRLWPFIGIDLDEPSNTLDIALRIEHEYIG